MSNQKFELLKEKIAKQTEQSVKNEIELKRERLRGYKDANNLLMKALWDIDLKLSQQDISPIEKEKLMTEQADIEKTLEQEHYSDKIEELKNEIIELEVAAFGSSELSSNSPYRL
ncbi:MAG: hypothetical protein PSV35_05780 [bacterium]|nr:hypothetical protein [bacterium]